jgi:hypothetical protein
MLTSYSATKLHERTGSRNDVSNDYISSAVGTGLDVLSKSFESS